jgi:hypothetical protein
VKRLFLLSLLVCFAETRARGALYEAIEEDGRISITPLAGFVGSWPGFGFDWNFGYKYAALGARVAGGSEMCVLCDRGLRGESQLSFLIGGRREFSTGFFMIRSGLAKVERKILDDSYPTGPDLDTHTWKGYGIPLQADIAWGGRFVGASLSLTILGDSEGGSGSVMLGLPFGRLRR